MKCWAEALGGCSNKQSGEHVISATFFGGSSVNVEGTPYTTGEPKTVGLDSIRANILCTRHNSDLSPVDVVSRELLDGFGEWLRLRSVREKLAARQPKRRWKIKRIRVDGSLVERWFLKTTINLMYISGKDHSWHLEDATAVRPPQQLVDAAFGLKPLAAPLGLYAAAQVGFDIDPKHQVRFGALTDQDGRFVAGLFSFCGLLFVMWLVEQEPPATLRIPSAPGSLFDGMALLYRRCSYRAAFNGRLSHALEINWPGGKARSINLGAVPNGG